MSTRSYLSIGDVLSLLREEFPDVTISKIRFLESQGLVDPERSPSGYRKFYDHDVDRLRWVLRQQRDQFLPLKVIRDRLAAAGNGVPVDDEDEPRPGSVSGGPGHVWTTDVWRDPEAEAGTLGPATGSTGGEHRHEAGLLRGREGEGANVVHLDSERRHTSSGHPAAAPSGEGPGQAGSRPGTAAHLGANPGPGSGPGSGPDRPVDGATDLTTSRDDVQAGAADERDPSGAAGGARPAAGAAAGPAAEGPGEGSAEHPGVGGHGAAPAGGDATHGGLFAGLAGRDAARGSTSGSEGSQGGAANAAAGPHAGWRGGGPRGEHPSGPGGNSERPGRPVPGAVAGGADTERAGSPLSGSLSGVSLTLAELSAATGLSPQTLATLEGFGLIAPMAIAGETFYDEEALTVTKLVVEFSKFGIEPRHLRLYRNAVDRETGLVEQVITPLLRQRNPEARQRAMDAAADLTRLGQSLRAALVRGEVRRLFGG